MGCSPKIAKKPPPPKKPSNPATIISPNGEADSFSKDSTHEHLWHIRWKEAEFNVVGETPTVGKMTAVDGQIFQSKDTKDFKADKGQADKQANTLTLTGNVSVKSPKEGSHLICDKLVYDANKKIFEATGNVSVTNKAVKITGVPAAIANSDFSEVSSPDLFKGQNAIKKK